MKITPQYLSRNSLTQLLKGESHLNSLPETILIPKHHMPLPFERYLAEFSCGVMGYSCIDPVAPCSIPGLVFRDLEESSGSDSPTSSPTPSPTAGPVADKRDSDAGETASTSNDSSSSTTTGVIVGVSAAVVVIGVGMYFYKKKRSSGRYDATSDYAAAGHLT